MSDRAYDHAGIDQEDVPKALAGLGKALGSKGQRGPAGTLEDLIWMLRRAPACPVCSHSGPVWSFGDHWQGCALLQWMENYGVDEYRNNGLVDGPRALNPVVRMEHKDYDYNERGGDVWMITVSGRPYCSVYDDEKVATWVKRVIESAIRRWSPPE